MKSMISSLLLFSLMLIGIAWNSRYVKCVSEELSSCISSIPLYSEADAEADSVRSQSIERFTHLWDASQVSVSLSLPIRITEGIDDTFDLLKASFHHGEKVEFDQAREHLLRILSDMTKHEQFYMSNIL